MVKSFGEAENLVVGWHVGHRSIGSETGLVGVSVV